MKILVSAAKTGGHIFPAIAVGHEISKLGHDVIFMGSGEPIDCLLYTSDAADE